MLDPDHWHDESQRHAEQAGAERCRRAGDRLTIGTRGTFSRSFGQNAAERSLGWPPSC
jgi:hypothetical protein